MLVNYDGVKNKKNSNITDRFRPPIISAAVQCPSLLQPDNGFVSCGDDAGKHQYGNTCSFSCAAGYLLVGPSKMTCTSAAVWSERKPRCEGEGGPTVESNHPP